MLRSTRWLARCAALAATLGATLAVPSGASAQLSLTSASAPPPVPCFLPGEEIRDVSGAGYHVRLCGATDVDQHRSGLAGLGSTHCGPAALFNSLQYLTRRYGVPVSMDPGGDTYYMKDNDPLDPADNWDTTWWLMFLGLNAGMQEGAVGSNLSENRAAFHWATAAAAAKGWDFNVGWDSTSETPEFGYLLAHRLKSAPVQLAYGRYYDTGNTHNGEKIYKRDGGHVVTVVEAKGTIGSGEVELLLHDPGRAADHGMPYYEYSQSPYRLERVKLTKRTVMSEYVEEDKVSDTGGSGGGGVEKVTRWELSGANYKSTARVLVEAYNHFSASKP